MRHSIVVVTVLFLLITGTPSFSAQPLSPAELDTLNYTHIKFHWLPMIGAENYHLQVAGNIPYDPFDNALVHDIQVPTNAVVLKSGFDWGNSYTWRYWGLDGEGEPMDTSFVHQFDIRAFPDSLRILEAAYDDLERVQPGLTLFDLGSPILIAADLEGNPVWFLEGGRDVQLLPSGRMLFTYGETRTEYITETDLQGFQYFRSPENIFHHEVELLPNGNFLALSVTHREVLDPYGADTVKVWEGDLLVEMNRDGEIVWTWDAFDHFTTDDFDSTRFASDANRAVHDWTHGNAAHLTPDGNGIYMSFRHLSRITMIEYPSGKVLWNMGRQLASNDVHFGQELNFNYQHEPILLDNGNFLLYDNHNLGPEDSTRALELRVDPDGDPQVEVVWEHWLDEVSSNGGSAYRLDNGNTLIANRPLRYTVEVTPAGEEVWRLTKVAESSGGMYRAVRIPDLYPLVYTLRGPDNEAHIPDEETYLQFDINNLGYHGHTYAWRVTDSEGWFDTGSRVRIAGGENLTVTAYGLTPEGEHPDTVYISVFPVNDYRMTDMWTAVVVSDPNMTAPPEPGSPDNWLLLQNCPNPFNSTTTFNITLNRGGLTTLAIYDLSGRRVGRLIQSNLPAGQYQSVWDGRNLRGMPVGSGSYYYLLTSGGNSTSGRVTLLR